MARKIYLSSPQNMTFLMCELLGNKLNDYVDYSNGHLCSMDHVDGPVWAMQLYKKDGVHWAILEEIAGIIYIYEGPFTPKEILPTKQKYKRKFVLQDGSISHQIGTVKEAKNGEVYLLWEEK